MITSKSEFEQLYNQEDPWKFNNTLNDHVRRDIFLDHVYTVLNQKPQRRVLDAGCGVGYLTKDLANSYNVQIEAFDISEKAIQYAFERNHHNNIHFFQSDIREFNSDTLFDLIVCEEALYYLDDEQRVQAIQKFHSLLHPSAHLKISVVIIGQNNFGRYFTLEQIKSIITGNGFDILSIVPSIVHKFQSISQKLLYYSLSKIYRFVKLKIFVSIMKAIVLRYPLEQCYQVSLLARKL